MPLNGLSVLLGALSMCGEPAAAHEPRAELSLGYEVSGRELVPVDGDNVFLEGETVVAWSAVGGVTGGFVEHVWLRDGIEVARHNIKVGPSPRWRTWSRQRVKAGTYEVRVVGPDGETLASTILEVDDPIGC